jgi:hypothetical protein
MAEFFEHPPSGQSLWLRRLLFRLGRGPPTSEAEDFLRCNLVSLVEDSAALEIPVAILSRVFDFRSCEGRREEYERLFTFCIEYLKARGSPASQIFRTLGVTRLGDEDLGRMCALEELNWGVLSESVGRSLIGLRQELSRAQQRKEDLEKEANQQGREIRNLQNEAQKQARVIEDLGKEVARKQSEKVAMKVQIAE